MPEVQNIGANDYAQQYQPSQYQYEDYADYNTQPQVYDEEAAEVKNASKSRLGATALGAIIIGGLAYWGGHHFGSKGAKKELQELQNAADKYKDFIDKQAKDLEKEADKVIDTKMGGFQFGKDFAKKVKEELKKLKDLINGTESKEGTEKAAEETKKAAEETKKTEEQAK